MPVPLNLLPCRRRRSGENGADPLQVVTENRPGGVIRLSFELTKPRFSCLVLESFYRQQWLMGECEHSLSLRYESILKFG